MIAVTFTHTNLRFNLYNKSRIILKLELGTSESELTCFIMFTSLYLEKGTQRNFRKAFCIHMALNLLFFFFFFSRKALQQGLPILFYHSRFATAQIEVRKNVWGGNSGQQLNKKKSAISMFLPVVMCAKFFPKTNPLRTPLALYMNPLIITSLWHS